MAAAASAAETMRGLEHHVELLQKDKTALMEQVEQHKSSTAVILAEHSLAADEAAKAARLERQQLENEKADAMSELHEERVRAESNAVEIRREMGADNDAARQAHAAVLVRLQMHAIFVVHAPNWGPTSSYNTHCKFRRHVRRAK